MAPVLGLLLGAGGASAATTVGSQLTLAPVVASCGGTATFMNTALAAGTLQAPIDGVVLRWRLALAAPGGGSFTYKLRVLRPAGGGMYMGAGTGPAQTAPSTGVNVLTLASPLPVKAGDLIGIECPSGAPSPFANGAPASSSIGSFSPPLADGEARSPSGPFVTNEMLINADVESDCDRDGLGDETQDTNTSSCSPVAPPTCKGKPATIVGTEGTDVRKGTSGKDVIVGLGGNDKLSGLAGNDLICGGAGKDTLKGGKGNDKLYGEAGKDTLKGGPGKDKLKGGAGKDKQVQ
jgi:hypothetical protein